MTSAAAQVCLAADVCFSCQEVALLNTQDNMTTWIVRYLEISIYVKTCGGLNNNQMRTYAHSLVSRWHSSTKHGRLTSYSSHQFLSPPFPVCSSERQCCITHFNYYSHGQFAPTCWPAACFLLSPHTSKPHTFCTISCVVFLRMHISKIGIISSSLLGDLESPLLV